MAKLLSHLGIHQFVQVNVNFLKDRTKQRLIVFIGKRKYKVLYTFWIVLNYLPVGKAFESPSGHSLKLEKKKKKATYIYSIIYMDLEFFNSSTERKICTD